MNTDRIEKQILLRATRERVWKAISNSEEFGTWFGVKLDGPFQAGAILRGTIVGTKVNAEVAAMQKPYEGKLIEFTVEKITPGELLSFRWHPHAIDPNKDFSQEPATLVEFRLKDVDGGTLLTVTESGFNRIPLERRATAFSANEQGWAIQMTLIGAYLARES